MKNSENSVIDLSNRKILVYRLGSLGDTVMVLPCFHKIKEHYPNADITLLTNNPVSTKAAAIESILGRGYFFHSILNYPLGTRNPLLLLNLIKQIWSRKIDTVINLAANRTKKSTLRDRFFFRVAGVRHLIGFPSHDSDYKLVTDPQSGMYEWEAKRLSRRISELGGIDLKNEYYWDLRLSETETNLARKALGNFVGSDNLIAISLGTKFQPNNWEMPNWLNMLKQLRTELPGWKLVMLGALDEEQNSELCLNAWGGEGINLCGKTSPRVSAAVLKHIRVFVGHDSGPMHLAGCVGTPSVGIYSARHFPGQWFPRGEANQIIYHQPECAGCEIHICIENQKKCILSITVPEVIQAIKNIIKE